MEPRTEINLSNKGERGEGQRNQHRIYFEPGIHEFLPQRKDKIMQRFKSGDLTAHYWISGSRIATRMREYAPQVIAIDSLPASSYKHEAPLRQARTWLWLPASPREISGRDSIYVVGGDPLIQNLFDGTSSKPGDEFYEFEKVIENLDNKNLNDYIAKLTREELATFIPAAILIGTVHYLATIRARQKVTSMPESTGSSAKVEKQPKKMSRRKFLALALGGTAAIVAGRALGVPALASFSSSGRVSEFWQSVMDVTRHRFSSSAWLDGRTAVLIAKTREAMNILKMPADAQAAVLMGTAHGYGVQGLLKDENKRAKIIAEYAREVMEALIELDFKTSSPSLVARIKADKKFAEEYRKSIKEILTDHLSAMEIVQVEDPDAKRVDNPWESINKSIIPVIPENGSPISEGGSLYCSEVKNAVLTLA